MLGILEALSFSSFKKKSSSKSGLSVALPCGGTNFDIESSLTCKILNLIIQNK
jgi:hypothetical protein